MRIFLLCLLLGAVTCHKLETANGIKDKLDDGGIKEKGFIDWVNQLLGGGVTTTTLRPTEDPPQNCPTCQCGIPRTRRRIVGGYETKELEFPWMAVLLYNNRFYCGGSLINDLYVLTAAHCTAGFRKERMSVRFLEHKRSDPNETKTIDRKVEAIIRHLRYNPNTYDNDIALLKLDERIDLSNALKHGRDGGYEEKDNDGLRPVCLPDAGLSYAEHMGVVAGWGTTEEGGSVSDTLQEVSVPIISNADCKKTAYKNRITENMLCAGEPEGGRDACQGDSGGPLHILKNDTAQFHEVGIVSWGEGCARPDRPGVYTRLNRYLTWLKSNTKDACTCNAGLSYAEHMGVVAGWGTTEEGGSVSDTLQEVSVPIISNADCKKTAYKNRITENMLCAGEPEGGRDACQGDSGGPLHILKNDTAQFHEVGIVSWGEGCARPDRPGVYTRLNRYLTWLKSNTKDACTCS